MKQLYIIGNGFDIHHCMPSRYSDYNVWLNDNYPGLMERLRNFYNVDNKDWWNEFELELGYPDMSEYIEETAFENQPDYGSDEFRDRDYHAGQFTAEDEIGKLVADIKGTFTEWISSLPAPNGSKMISLDKEDSSFINFNYTDTLQNLYQIPNANIIHIHGKAGNDTDLVLGHNREYEDLDDEFTPDYPEHSEDLKADEIAEWYEDNYDNGEDFIHQSVRQAVVTQISHLRKDVQSIISTHMRYFKTLKDIQIVYIYGLSFSPIDLPYLDEVIRNVNKSTTKWNVSYYSEKDKVSAQQYFEDNGIKEVLVNYVKLEDLQLINQLKLQF